jgi:hypothetical protein
LILILLAVRTQKKILWVFNGVWAGLQAYIRPEAIVMLVIVLFGYTLANVLRSKPDRRVAQAETAALASAPQIALSQKSVSKGRMHHLLIALFIVLGALLTVTPWTVRNWVRLGMFVPLSTTGCMNIWIGNTEGADGGYFWPQDPAINPTVLRPGETEQTWYRRSCQAAMAALSEEPLRTLRLWPQKIIKLWAHDHDLVYWNFAGAAQQFPQRFVDFVYWLADLYYWVILCLAIAAVLVWLKGSLSAPSLSRWFAQQPLEHWLISATLAGFTLVYLPFFGSPRFHFALFPLLVLLAGRMLLALHRWLWLLVGRYAQDWQKSWE